MPIVFANVLAAAAVVLCLSAPGTVWSQDSGTSISTGHEGGNYFLIGSRLNTAMLVEHGFRVDVQVSSGSIQNIARLADSESATGLALTQSDALGRFLQSNPEFANKFIVLGDAGKECAILITAKRGGADSFASLKSLSGGDVSVDDPGSGAAATFDYLRAMDPELRDTQPVFVDTMEALLQMKVAGSHTDLKAAMLVQRPSKASPPVKIALDNPNDYQLVPILAADVRNGRLPDDSDVYTFERVRIESPETSASTDVDTICTRSLLIASKEKLSREARSKLARTMLESSKAIFAEGN